MRQDKMRRSTAATALLIALAGTACTSTGNQAAPSLDASPGKTQDARLGSRTTHRALEPPVAASGHAAKQSATGAPGSFTPAGFGNNLTNGGYEGPLSSSCGVERWHIKTGIGSGAAKVDTSSPQTVSIAQLADAPAPTGPGSDIRYGPVETHTWTLHAVLTDYKKEADSDYHLVLLDTSGRSMIAEIPAPDCTGS